MTVDGQAVADRLRPVVPSGSTAELLLAQLHSDMVDLEFAAVAIGIVRALAQKEAA
ncbi:MAG: hypothetical protein ACLQD8_05260 [Thermoplasmata archaeon]